MSPHHPLKSPFINSSSDSDEYVVVGNQAKASTLMSVVDTTGAVNRSKQEDSTDHHDNTAVTITGHVMPQVKPSVTEHDDKVQVQSTTQADDQNSVLLSSQLEQVRRDLQSILNRLNSLEVLLQRRRVSMCILCTAIIRMYDKKAKCVLKVNLCNFMLIYYHH